MSNYYKLTATDKSVVYLIKNFTEEQHRYSAEISIGFKGSVTYFLLKLLLLTNKFLLHKKLRKKKNIGLKNVLNKKKL